MWTWRLEDLKTLKTLILELRSSKSSRVCEDFMCFWESLGGSEGKVFKSSNLQIFKSSSLHVFVTTWRLEDLKFWRVEGFEDFEGFEVFKSSSLGWNKIIKILFANGSLNKFNNISNHSQHWTIYSMSKRWFHKMPINIWIFRNNKKYLSC